MRHPGYLEDLVDAITDLKEKNKDLEVEKEKKEKKLSHFVPPKQGIQILLYSYRNYIP